MQEIYGEFEKRNIPVIAISQEDDSLQNHAKMHKNLKPEPRFILAADIGRKKTGKLKRTTAYLIDEQGRVREIFPMTVQSRPSWQAVLNAIDAVRDSSESRSGSATTRPAKAASTQGN